VEHPDVVLPHSTEAGGLLAGLAIPLYSSLPQKPDEMSSFKIMMRKFWIRTSTDLMT
jgi:hypothetical protein